jgi:hypothetical protein
MAKMTEPTSLLSWLAYLESSTEPDERAMGAELRKVCRDALQDVIKEIQDGVHG